ncbi:hypothetical protein FAK_38730 [Desulfoferula mesophila]|uniref:Uncharacterized protein n=1 Tax=Desulfoferula mesophila TaxID=3058419 RepID=A0AAU9EK90_9BACT|nr:hypothetical protein FAK_38730 [Desulfoferula mesophilus]
MAVSTVMSPVTQTALVAVNRQSNRLTPAGPCITGMAKSAAPKKMKRANDASTRREGDNHLGMGWRRGGGTSPQGLISAGAGLNGLNQAYQGTGRVGGLSVPLAMVASFVAVLVDVTLLVPMGVLVVVTGFTATLTHRLGLLHWVRFNKFNSAGR